MGRRRAAFFVPAELQISAPRPDNSLVSRRPQRTMLCVEMLLGAIAVAASVTLEPLRRPDGLALVGLFLALALASDAFAIKTDRGQDISGSLLAIVLAIALTGPTGGVLVGTVSALVDGVRARRPFSSQASNVAAYAIFPFAGGMVLEWLASAHDASVGGPAYVAGVMAGLLGGGVRGFF